MLAFIISLSVCLTIFIITSIIVLIQRQKRKKRYPGEVINAPVIVTSATHTAPAGYTTTQLAPNTTMTYQTQAYSTPYPQGIPTHMPMPAGQNMVIGFQQNAPPYPTMMAASSMNPPSYDAAISNAKQPINH